MVDAVQPGFVKVLAELLVERHGGFIIGAEGFFDDDRGLVAKPLLDQSLGGGAVGLRRQGAEEEFRSNLAVTDTFLKKAI